MGFFKKIFKGIKKVFKKIGKAVKSVFKKVGKFMGKIGIVGQLGLALIMPYALPALGGLATGMMGTPVGGFLGSAIKGAGHFLNAAVKLGTRVGAAFKSVTSAVTKTIGNMVGATINSIPGGEAFGGFMKELTGGAIDITGKNFSTAWKATQDAWSTAGDSLGNLFAKSTFDSSMNKFGIQANLQESVGKTLSPDSIEIAGPTQDGSLLQAEALGPQQIAYDPVTGQRSFVTGSLDITDPNFSINERLGLGTPDKLYSTGNLPLGVDESVFTVEGVRPTYQATPLDSSLLAPADGIERATTKAIEGYQAPAMLDTSMTPAKSLAAQAGARSKEFLKSQGVELTTAGAITMAQDYLDAESAEAQMQRLTDPFANIDMGYLTPQPIQTSGGLSTAGLTPMSGWDYFNQIQDDILNSNFSNIYSQGYYGSPSLQAGLAMAYQELNQ